MQEVQTKKKEKSATIEVLMEGPGGELYFQPVEATPSHLEELKRATNNSMIKHNLDVQLEKLRRKRDEKNE